MRYADLLQALLQPRGGLGQMYLPDSDPNAPQGDASTYLATLPEGMALGAMTPYAAGVQGAWGGTPPTPATARFQPDAVLDPSQVIWWTGAQNPWRGWFDRMPRGAYFDGLTDDPRPYAWGPRNSYPYGPQWDAWWNAPPPAR
jgi:hypothetical protein